MSRESCLWDSFRPLLEPSQAVASLRSAIRAPAAGYPCVRRCQPLLEGPSRATAPPHHRVGVLRLRLPSLWLLLLVIAGLYYCATSTVRATMVPTMSRCGSMALCELSCVRACTLILAWAACLLLAWLAWWRTILLAQSLMARSLMLRAWRCDTCQREAWWHVDLTARRLLLRSWAVRSLMAHSLLARSLMLRSLVARSLM